MSEFVTLDQISDFGDLIPAGEDFWAKAVKIAADLTKAKEGAAPGTTGGKPYVAVTFNVLSGKYEGIDFTKWYFLNISKGKNGKLYARGVMQLKKDMEAIGKPLPADHRFAMEPTLNEAQGLAQIVGERVRPTNTPRIHFKSIGEQYQEQDPNTQQWVDAHNADGSPKMRTVYVVIGTGAEPAGAPIVQTTTGTPPPAAQTVAQPLDLV